MNASGMSALQSLPERFRRAPRAYDVWQAYMILSCFAGDEWEHGWSFGFPASLSFPATEVEGLGVAVIPGWKGPRKRRRDGREQAGRNTSFYNCPALRTPAHRGHPAPNPAPDAPWLRLDVNLPGLLGPGGPLPLHFCEAVLQETHEGNAALREFLDLFQSRLMRLWMRNLSVMCQELGPIKPEADDVPALCTFALSGMLVGGLRNNPQTVIHPGPPWKTEQTLSIDAFPDTAPLWALHPPSAAGLEELLRKCLGFEARVEQFCGAWRDLPRASRSRLGGVNSRLGEDALLGRRVFDSCGGVTLHISEKRKLSLGQDGCAIVDDDGDVGKLPVEMGYGRCNHGKLACFVVSYLGSETMSVK